MVSPNSQTSGQRVPLLTLMTLISAGIGTQAETKETPLASANMSPIPAVSVSRREDVWIVAPTIPIAAGRYQAKIYVDEKLVREGNLEPYRIAGLARGVHPVAVIFSALSADLGAPEPSFTQKLLIREIDNQLSAKEPDELHDFDFPIRIKDAKGPAVTVRVTQDDLVELKWISDAPVEIHLHGYDIEGSVEPGVPLAMIFDANIAGRFSVETHQQSGHRTLAFIDVYPR